MRENMAAGSELLTYVKKRPTVLVGRFSQRRAAKFIELQPVGDSTVISARGSAGSCVPVSPIDTSCDCSSSRSVHVCAASNCGMSIGALARPNRSHRRNTSDFDLPRGNAVVIRAGCAGQRPRSVTAENSSALDDCPPPCGATDLLCDLLVALSLDLALDSSWLRVLALSGRSSGQVHDAGGQREAGAPGCSVNSSHKTSSLRNHSR